MGTVGIGDVPVVYVGFLCGIHLGSFLFVRSEMSSRVRLRGLVNCFNGSICCIFCQILGLCKGDGTVKASFVCGGQGFSIAQVMGVGLPCPDEV